MKISLMKIYYIGIDARTLNIKLTSLKFETILIVLETMIIEIYKF